MTQRLEMRDLPVTYTTLDASQATVHRDIVRLMQSQSVDSQSIADTSSRSPLAMAASIKQLLESLDEEGSALSPDHLEELHVTLASAAAAVQRLKARQTPPDTIG